MSWGEVDSSAVRGRNAMNCGNQRAKYEVMAEDWTMKKQTSHIKHSTVQLRAIQKHELNNAAYCTGAKDSRGVKQAESARPGSTKCEVQRIAERRHET